jgi:hypothetical protein
MPVALFEEGRAAIAQMYDDWDLYRNEQGTGKLDRAFATRDPALCREALNEVSDMNFEFTRRAAERYASMLNLECACSR